MKDLLKELILSKIDAEGETPGCIATYGIIRHASSVMSLKIYWNRKAMAGSKTMLHIELDSDPSTGQMAITVMEEILKETISQSLEDKLNKQKKNITSKEGGKW